MGICSENQKKDSTALLPDGQIHHGRDFIYATQTGAYPAVRCFILCRPQAGTELQ
jgi:hypothetical protein